MKYIKRMNQFAPVDHLRVRQVVHRNENYLPRWAAEQVTNLSICEDSINGLAML